MSQFSRIRDHPLSAPLLLLAVAVPLILWGLGSYSLVNSDEEFYHLIAEAMVASGDWLTTLDYRGEHRIYDTFMNAPLQYWARAVLISLFGSSLWTMRLLTALAGVATVLMTYRLGLRGGDRSTALLAGAIQLTTFQFLYLHGARTGELDTLVCFLFCAAAWSFLRAAEDGRSFVPHHLCLAVLVTVKLPLVLVPAAAGLAACALHPPWRGHLRRWCLTGLAVLPLALAWHVGQLVVLWEPFRAVAATMLREATGERYEGSLGGKLLFYLRTLGFGSFPWAVVYPFALAAAARRWLAGRLRADCKLFALYLLSIGFYLLVFKHLPWYVLPAYPFLSLFAAAWLRRLAGDRPLALVAAAVSVALLIWVDVAAGTFNPFAKRAFEIEMPIGLRGGLGPAGAGLVVLTAAVVVGLLWWLRGQRPALLRRRLAPALTVLLLGFALLRSSSALAHLGYQSPMARLRRDLDAARATNPPLATPVRLPIDYGWDGPFYLADAYEVFLVRQNGDRYYVIRERKSPP